MSGTALGHLRLLDLSRQLPGPFCSTLLADLGMDVLVVAAPQDPFGVGIPFLARNKRSMTLNLKHVAGRDVFHKRAIVSANPFFPAAPFGPFNALARTALRRPSVAALRRWVTPRPVVVIRPERAGA